MPGGRQMLHSLLRASSRTFCRAAAAGPLGRRVCANGTTLEALGWTPTPLRSLSQRQGQHQAVSASRPYSQAQAQVQAQNKIWDFQQVQKVAQAANESTPSNIILVDAREPGEIESTGRIPTAINIPITSRPDSFHITDQEFADRFDFARPSRDTELIFYCKAGVRSRAAAQLARDAGWKNVGEYPGSWLDWEKNGGDVQR